MSAVPAGWRVFFLSMLPVTELRAALPLGVLWGLAPRRAYMWALAGNLVPVLPLLLGLERLFSCLRFFGSGPVAALADYGRRRRDRLGSFSLPGLMALVALPLPGTGVWTGCLVAAALGLKKLPASAAISLGAAAAGIAVGMTAAGVAAAERAGGRAAAAAAAAIFAAVYGLLLRKERKH
ncbi:MAG: small multi-drug export protein [Firmicutes bacterium]|nr:small multi-drug export protein [Bacillota bacterium]MBQ6607457.1 small multi-drug export protein [Bacillota bacterium]